MSCPFAAITEFGTTRAGSEYAISPLTVLVDLLVNGAIGISF